MTYYINFILNLSKDFRYSTRIGIFRRNNKTTGCLECRSVLGHKIIESSGLNRSEEFHNLYFSLIFFDKSCSVADK